MDINRTRQNVPLPLSDLGFIILTMLIRYCYINERVAAAILNIPGYIVFVAAI